MKVVICGNIDRLTKETKNKLALDYTPNGDLIIWYDENTNTYNIKRKDCKSFDGTEKVGGIFLNNTSRPETFDEIIECEIKAISAIKKDNIIDYKWSFSEDKTKIIIKPISLDQSLIDYIEYNIFPKYSRNDAGHNIDHISYVISRSMKFAKQVKDINYNMVYTIAVYHDLGHFIDAKNHELVSARMLLNDDFLKLLFSSEEIKTMAEAIEDHRASIKGEPRSVYGKIVSSADRNVILEEPLKRTYAYRIKHFPNMSLDELIEESRQHIINKFGSGGYATEKMYFDDSEYKKFLKNIFILALNEEEFSKKYCEVNGIKCDKALIRK